MAWRSWWRVGQWVVGAVIVATAATQLARNWDALRRQQLDWEIRPVYLLAAALLTWAAYAGLIETWRATLRSWGAPIGAYAAARIWTISNLGKYLPGKVWAIAGMAVMAQRVGVPPWVATAAAVLLQALAIAAGAVVVGITGLATVEAAYPWFRPALLAVAGISAAAIALLAWRPFTDRLFRLVRLEPPQAGGPGPGLLLVASLVNAGAWVLYGSAFWLLARGLLPGTALEPVLAIGAFTASYLAGFLALVAPGGLLVREGVLILMLQGAVGPAAAAALAVASRILLTFTEFGAAVPFVVRPGELTRVNSGS